MDFDLDNFDSVTAAEAGREFELTDPRTGAGAGCFVTLQGMDSQTYRDIQAEQARRNLERIQKARKIQSNPADRIAEGLDLLAGCTVAWRGFRDKSGAEIAFSKKAAREIYARYPAIREQVDLLIHDRANFLPPASTS